MPTSAPFPDARSPRAGGCHCGAVRFSADLPRAFSAIACNCSICAKSGNVHVIVPAARFRLTRGAAALADYAFGSGAARHRFCRTCGVKSFYVPRSNPDGVAVTYRCLDDWADLNVTVVPFDGRNWEQNAAALAHLSRE